jgi:hypothetical protein
MPENEMDDEIKSLFEYLGLSSPAEARPSQTSPGGSTRTAPGIPAGLRRLDFNRLRELFKSEQEFSNFQTKIYEKSQAILNKYREEPYGTKIRFTVDGKVFIALLEEHEGGAVQGKHPGISVLEEISNTAPISKISPAVSNTADLSKIDSLDQTYRVSSKIWNYFRSNLWVQRQYRTR